MRHGLCGHDPRRRGADLHAARRVGRGRVEVADIVAHRQRQAQPARRVDPAAIAIHRDRQQRVVEPAPVVVEQQDRVLEGVAERMVQRLVGIGHVDAALDQPGREVFAGLAVAAQAEGLVGRLAPRVVGRPAMLPRLDVAVLIGEHGKGRDDVLLEVFVLVVAEHDDHVGLEIVECGPRLGEMAAIDLARPAGRRRAPVVAELGAQRRRPVRRVLLRRRHVRVVERGPHHKGPVLVPAQHQRPVRAPQLPGSRPFSLPPFFALHYSDAAARRPRESGVPELARRQPCALPLSRGRTVTT